jgi:hypothetical protein
MTNWEVIVNTLSRRYHNWFILNVFLKCWTSTILRMNYSIVWTDSIPVLLYLMQISAFLCLWFADRSTSSRSWRTSLHCHLWSNSQTQSVSLTARRTRSSPRSPSVSKSSFFVDNSSINELERVFDCYLRRRQCSFTSSGVSSSSWWRNTHVEGGAVWVAHYVYSSQIPFDSISCQFLWTTRTCRLVMM